MNVEAPNKRVSSLKRMGVYKTPDPKRIHLQHATTSVVASEHSNFPGSKPSAACTDMTKPLSAVQFSQASQWKVSSNTRNYRTTTEQAPNGLTSVLNQLRPISVQKPLSQSIAPPLKKQAKSQLESTKDVVVTKVKGNPARSCGAALRSVTIQMLENHMVNLPGSDFLVFRGSKTRVSVGEVYCKVQQILERGSPECPRNAFLLEDDSGHRTALLAYYYCNTFNASNLRLSSSWYRFIGGIKYDRKEQRPVWHTYFICEVLDVNELAFGVCMTKETEKMIRLEL